MPLPGMSRSAAALLLLAACVDPGDPATGSAEQPIVHGALATDWMVRRAVKPLHCSATLVDQRFVLTALHCVWGGIDADTRVHFYQRPEEASQELGAWID